MCVAGWRLTDSPAGCVVDTIKEPSNVAAGDLTSSPPTRSATLRCSLSCGLKSFTNHVNKYPGLSILWFFTPEYKESCAFVVATEIQDDLGGCQEHVKNICSHKERPIGINGVACSRGHGKWVFESVCVREGACLVWVSQTHLFPSRMDLMGATGQGADRFIRVVISGCPVSQSAVLQLPGLQWQP